MKSHLQVLIVEDSENDMLLTIRELHRGGYTFDYLRVDTQAAMQAALDRQSWDLTIADYSLPTFSAPAALKLLQSQHLDLPFIIVSGTIGEEIAVKAMKAGAHDYITKGNLARLVPAVERELREAKERQKRQIAEQALQASEAELRESEARYRLLFESNPNPMWVFDLETLAFISVNQAAIEHYGYSQAEFLQMTISDLTLPQNVNSFPPQRPSLTPNPHYVEVWKHRKRDGSSIDVEIQTHNFTFGGRQSSLALINDITDWIQAAAELHVLKTALESAVEGISRLDLHGHYISVNAAYAKLVGYEPAEMIGMEWQQTIHPEDLSSMETVYRYMLHHGKVEAEARGIRKDGSSFYKQLFMILSFDRHQQINGHYCFAKDITERKQAEQIILEQAALLDVTTDAISVRDLDHHILFWNKGAERLYGWDRAAALGKNAIELLCPPGELPPQLAEIQATVMQIGHWQGEFQHITQDGKRISIESQWTLVRDEAGNPKSILTVSTDITAKKLLAAQFLRAQRMESLGTLASRVAHDFNNILTPILAATQLLPIRLPELAPQDLRLLKMMEDSAKRGADLVRQILEFASGSVGNRLPLQVRDLLVEVLEIVQQTFPATITVHSDIPRSDLWFVAADATQLHQVLMNLCVNARDAMPEGGTLSVILADRSVTPDDTLGVRSGDYVTIELMDTGSGIAPDVIDRIFDPFFTTKAQGQGTGLGLATVMGIIKNYGGFITVASEVGQGTQFTVYLPAIHA